MVFTQGRGFVVGASLGLPCRLFRWHLLVCHAADTASLATLVLFGKLIGVTTLFDFGEKRCRKNLPLGGLRFSMTIWQDGTRVSISPHAFWPDGGAGTVRPFPNVAAELAGGADGCLRSFEGAKVRITMVWVVFDSPLMDGDGPYPEGEIETTELTLLD